MQIAQTYETVIADRESGYALRYIVIPARSIAAPYKSALNALDIPSLLSALNLQTSDTPDITSSSQLPLVISAILSTSNVLDAAQQLRSSMTYPASDIVATPYKSPLSEFSEYCVSAEIIPFESSPLNQQALATIMAAGAAAGAKAALVGAGSVGLVAATPVLILVTALGIIIGAAAAATAFISIVSIFG